MASGGPSGPCFLALSACDQTPIPLHKESCGGREKTVPKAPTPMTPPPGPQHTGPSKQTRQVQFLWVWVKCLDFLRFDFAY